MKSVLMFSELRKNNNNKNTPTIINECADNLESMISRSTVSIDALKNFTDFVFTEIE